ncbi:hypothetical protein [Candidatus Viridilinea mediisalina]|uniref:Uncharacterized protein n=1 Tax=Candidatus Viridilinea mediisalina TaxID=2024553 RepID=A0A2A6RMX5_9CHLR|nr:hypothetical protein [Candidatus Viridilinea mediisalina]PDW04275.1 hypothetical protein CJ255_04285 [Candidatus Viridilinea mediisalina]
MSDRSSPLNQRLRRLLGTNSLHAPDQAPSGDKRPPDSSLLFESQITRLSQALLDLRTLDQQRASELCELRDQLRLTQSRVHAALHDLDELIGAIEGQLRPPPPAATLFERMRASSTAPNLEPERRAELSAWLTALKRLRIKLCAASES